MDRPTDGPQLRPTEISWTVSLAGNARDSTILLALSMFTSSGEQHYFFDLKGAMELAAAIDDLGGHLSRDIPLDDMLPAPLRSWLLSHVDGERCPACLDQPEPCSMPAEDAT